MAGWPAEIWRGFLGTLPPPVATELLTDAYIASYPAGRMVIRANGRPNPALILDGMLMAFTESADGRRAGLGYTGSGEPVGFAHLFVPDLPVSVLAITDARLLHFAPATVGRLARREASVAVALAVNLAERLGQYCGELRRYAFETARRRLAAQLQARAVTDQEGRLVVNVSHQEMADSIGSVREHVARLIAELRANGTVETRRSRIVILDETALRAAADGRVEERRAARRRALSRLPAET